jgi:hypothetical protein
MPVSCDSLFQFLQNSFPEVEIARNSSNSALTPCNSIPLQ